jgi:Chaperone of endosialidase
MERPKHVSRWIRRARISLAAGLLVALFIAATVRLAGAQTNTSLGTGAFASNVSGTDDSAFGFNALNLNTSGSGNTATGAGALQSNNGGNNTAAGFDALEANTTGSENTAIGVGALATNTTGFDNTAIGEGALFQSSTGSNNIGIGREAGQILNGSDNIAIGWGALGGNRAGNENTAVGTFALPNNGGSNNTAVGSNALGFAINGSSNMTGGNNIAIGVNAGSNTATGSNDIYIGNVGLADESNVIRIGTQQSRTVIAGINQAAIFGLPVVVNAFGRLGIQASSARYKRDIRDIGDASDRLMKLRPVTFRYKEDPSGRLQYGLVAEEVARVYPELVTNGDDGKPETVANYQLPAMLLNELQKQARENQRKDAQIAALQTQVGSLQKQAARIDGLIARLSALEQQARVTRPERSSRDARVVLR